VASANFFKTRVFKTTGLVFFLFYDQKPIIIKRQVSVIITIEIYFTCFGCIDMGKPFKLEAKPQQLILIGFGRLFSAGQKGFQYFSVFQQGIVNVSYKAAMASFGFLLVIIIVAAIVITEFFINSSFQGFSAGKTAFGIHRHRHGIDFNPLR
jgi:hypothetical protein